MLVGAKFSTTLRLNRNYRIFIKMCYVVLFWATSGIHFCTPGKMADPFMYTKNEYVTNQRSD